MTIYIADKLPQKSIEELRKINSVNVKYRPSDTAAYLEKSLSDASILIVRSTVVSKKCIDSSTNLSLIIRAGAGVNTINVMAASNAGVYVANCPGQNSIAVAELTMGLIMSLDRHLPDNVIDFRKGLWNKADYSSADGLYGKILGIAGGGRIGQEVIKRARAFGMSVVGYSRSLTPQKADDLGISYASTLKELASNCDILSIHLALKSETEKIITKKVLSRLKDGAFFINTARAGVIDEDALFDEVNSGRIRAALDLLSDEPEQKQKAFKSRFQKLSGVYVSHHIGASTKQAQLAVASEAVNIVRGYINEGRMKNWLNRCEHTKPLGSS